MAKLSLYVGGILVPVTLPSCSSTGLVDLGTGGATYSMDGASAPPQQVVRVTSHFLLPRAVRHGPQPVALARWCTQLLPAVRQPSPPIAAICRRPRPPAHCR